MRFNKFKRFFGAPLIGLFFALNFFASPLLSTPVYADPAPTTTPAETTTTTPEASPTDTSTTDTSSTTCSDQVGAIGWLVCPATGFLADTIDTLYGAIKSLLTVEPLSSDSDSPIFVIWNYARNISNIVFVIFILIVIYSQITGLGITNYGIKRTLPRIIVAAILVNLSFIICSLALDLSNIIGFNLDSFLASVAENAVASGSVNPDLNISVAEIFASVASGGAILGIAAAAGGGLTNLLILLIPVIVGGVVSTAIGFLMLALRQSVIALLIMISPLAFIAYLLPNTEKYFHKWSEILIQMLVFYPMFSLLFGASRLAGWVLMSSATNLLGIILGLAVQILPLFLALSLMKMSGSVLSGVSGFLAGLGAHAVTASRNYSGSHYARRRAKYLAETPRKFDLPRRLAQNLQDRRNRRAVDTQEYETTAQQRGVAYANQTYRRRHGTGGLTNRGRLHANMIARGMEYNRTITQASNDFDEGVAQFERPGSRRYRKAAALDSAMMNASDRLKYQQARSLDVNLENLKSYERRVNDAVTANNNRQLGKAYDAAALSRYKEIANVAGPNRGENGINTIVANALASKARVRTEITGDYELLLQEAAYTANIDDMLESAINAKNENIMAAAIGTMMQRGDTDLIGDKLEQFTRLIGSNSPEDLAIQKRLSDTMVRYKPDSAILWGYAKCLNMARGRAEATRRQNRSRQQNGEPLLEQIPDFFSFDDYLKSDGQAAYWGLDVNSMIKSADESIGGTQDRTAWSFAKDHDELYFTATQRRNALFGGVQVTGEKLLSLIDMHLGAGASWNAWDADGNQISSKSKRKVLTFKEVKRKDDNGNEVVVRTAEQALAHARDNISEMIKGNNADHFTKFKSDILSTFCTVMSDSGQVQPDGSIVFDFQTGDAEAKIVQGLQALIANGSIDQNAITTDLARKSSRGALGNMNKDTRRILNSVFHFDN